MHQKYSQIHDEKVSRAPVSRAQQVTCQCAPHSALSLKPGSLPTLRGAFVALLVLAHHVEPTFFMRLALADMGHIDHLVDGNASCAFCISGCGRRKPLKTVIEPKPCHHVILAGALPLRHPLLDAAEMVTIVW